MTVDTSPETYAHDGRSGIENALDLRVVERGDHRRDHDRSRNAHPLLDLHEACEYLRGRTRLAVYQDHQLALETILLWLG